jgi:hypothetical protein
MNSESAKIIKEHITKINYHRKIDGSIPHVDVETFLYKDGAIIEIID